MHSKSIRRALVAGAVLALAGAVQAGTTVDLSKLGPKQQAHWTQIMAKKAEITPQYNYDIKPAQLKRVSVGAKVDASRKNAQAVVSLLVSDNLSGVNQVNVTLMSPSGQTASAYWTSPYEATRNEVQLGVDMSNATENGTWRVYAVHVSDANGYGTYYDETALAAMGGRTTFAVTGAIGDYTPPTGQPGGINLTPTVSRSTPPRGMLPGAEARIGVQMKLADAGSGVRSASMEFCLDGMYWECIYLQGSVSVRGQNDVLLTLGGHVSGWNALGNYVPYSMYVYDQAGNSTYYWSDELNGLLDNPVITITE
jgi:hypothetical protein